MNELIQMRFQMLVDRKVIGLIDGFILHIQRPDHAGDAFYCGRPGKCIDSLNIQYVVDLNGNIIHVFTGVVGRAHDRNAIEWSHRFTNWLENLPQEFCVLGDSAYVGLHRNCLTILRNPQTQEQRAFNIIAKSIRVLVENTIGANETIWRGIMSKENRLPAKIVPDFAGNVVISAAVLHNRFTNYL